MYRPGMGAQPDRISWSAGVRMTRPAFLAITVVGCVLGIATATTGGGDTKAATALATVLLALVAHAASNVLNDYHDALNGADAANTEGLFPFTGGARLIQDGEVSAATTRRLAIGLLILVVPGGLLLAAHSGWGLLLVGTAGLLIGWMYSAPPLALMSRGFGEAAVAAAWALVVIGADYAQRGAFSRVAAFAGIGYGLLIGNILLINGFPDAAADEQVGKRTLVVRVGATPAAIVYLGVAIVSHAWLVAGVASGFAPSSVLLGMASLPFSLAAAHTLIRHSSRPGELRPAIVRTILAALLNGIGLAVGFVLAA